MANKGNDPGDTESAPIESRRTAAAADVGGLTSDETTVEDGQGSELDMPNLGEFSAESARPTPLDDIARAERERMPKD